MKAAVAKKPLIRVAVVESDPLRFVGFRALFDTEPDLELISASLADLGQLHVYWPEPGERSAIDHSPTKAPGFPTRAELMALYSEKTGRDLSQLAFYVSFAYWKLACILEGVYSRYVGGAMGDDGFDSSSYPNTIAWLGERSRAAAANLNR